MSSIAPRLLRIDASARQAGSHSRALADHFETRWLENHPAALVVRRDLAAQPVPQISADTITGYYTPADQHTDALRDATALSSALIAELQSADVLLISSPMYNFSAPAALKAWIDQIVRVGHTFAYDGKGYTGLVKVKRAYIAASYGAPGWANGGPMAAYDHLVPYLKAVLGFIGIPHVEAITVEGTSGDDAALAASLANAREAAIAAAAAA